MKSFCGSYLMRLVNGAVESWPTVPKNRVWPSLASFATYSAAMVPPAPPRFSTTNRLPVDCDNASAVTRAIRSVLPPAAYGTTMVTGFVGQSAATAAWLATARPRHIETLLAIRAMTLNMALLRK